MVPAAAALGVILVAFAAVARAEGAVPWPALLMAWALLRLGYSAILTPTGRLLRRSAQAADRPALFAAQFALSHGCWLLTYPLAGWLGSTAGIPVTLAVLGLLTLAGATLAALIWPAEDPEAMAHGHPNLPDDHPHLREHPAKGHRHAHAFVIDDLHRRWPSPG